MKNEAANQEKEYQQREELEQQFNKTYPDGFDRLSDEVEALKSFNLYCGACGHDLGCEHGVPAPRPQ